MILKRRQLFRHWRCWIDRITQRFASAICIASYNKRENKFIRFQIVRVTAGRFLFCCAEPHLRKSETNVESGHITSVYSSFRSGINDGILKILFPAFFFFTSPKVVCKQNFNINIKFYWIDTIKTNNVFHFYLINLFICYFISFGFIFILFSDWAIAQESWTIDGDSWFWLKLDQSIGISAWV